MSDGSSIEWTEATWNPVAGCTPVSPGCLNCYAAAMAHRLEAMGQEKYKGLTVLRNDVRTFNGKITLAPEALSIPLHWKKPKRIFVNSMADLFHADVPFDFVDQVFAVMALCPQHTFQVLTKRPERMAEYMRGRCVQGKATDTESIVKSAAVMMGRSDYQIQWPLPNVWLGTSVENQKAADERIPHLLKCPAAVRFLSCEPLLGAVDLFPKCPPEFQPHLRADRIGWVIVGGESGGGARACNLKWIRGIVAQCKAAGVPCFVKQLGADAYFDEFSTHAGDIPGYPVRLKSAKGGDPAEWPADLRVREMPTSKPKPPMSDKLQDLLELELQFGSGRMSE